MKILECTTFPPTDLGKLYDQNPTLAKASFTDQMTVIATSEHGRSRVNMSELKDRSHEINVVGFNCIPAQSAWAHTLHCRRYMEARANHMSIN